MKGLRKTSRTRTGWLFLLIVLIFSAFNTVGWIFDIPLMKGFHSGGTAMRLVTATCFILSVLALYMIQTGGRLLFVRISALIIALAGAFTLVIYVIEAHTGNESSLVSWPFFSGFLNQEHRMALISSILFILAGAVLFLLSLNNSGAIGFAHAVTIPIFIIGYFIPMGFLVGITSIFSINHIGVAVITGINFCLFSLAVFLLYPDTWLMKVFYEKFAGSKMARRLVAGIFTGPLVITWLRFNGERLGLYSSDTGIVLVGVTYTFFFFTLVWFIARSANKLDEKRNEIRENLRKSEDDYRQLVESARSIIIRLDSHGKFRFVNEYTVKFFGYNNKEEMIGKDVSMIIPEKETSGRDLSHLLKDVLSQPQNYPVFDNENIKKNGDVVWINWANRPIFDQSGNLVEILSIGNDNTERRRLEKEASENALHIKQSEERFRTLVSASSELQYRMNPDWSEMYQLRSQGFLANTESPNPNWLQEYIPGEDQPIVMKVIREAIRKKTVFELEHRVRRADGSFGWTFSRAVPLLNENGEIVEWFGAASDITEQKLAQQKLIAAKERAEESDRLKSAFIANLSHEIRTPMNGILGFADLLNTPGLSVEFQKKYIDAIRSSGKRMLGIIFDLINISKLEAGQMELKLAIIDINKVLDELFIFFLPEANEKGVMLKSNKDLPPDKILVETDKTKLMQILTNLIKNGLKFTPKGYVEFGCKLQGNYFLFYVKDTGMGIKKELHEQIFERFRQGEVEPSGIYEGTGLGLSISKAYVELLGGKISVESEPSRGSVFSFTIPFKELKDATIPLEDVMKADSKIAPVIEKAIACPTVLVTEDDPGIYFYLQQILMLKKIETIHARNGTEALEIIKSNKKIGLILMDIRMPGMSGLETIRHIRAINPVIPIIAQSAFNTEADIKSAFDAGCNDYVSKPFDREILLNKITKHCVS